MPRLTPVIQASKPLPASQHSSVCFNAPAADQLYMQPAEPGCWLPTCCCCCLLTMHAVCPATTSAVASSPKQPPASCQACSASTTTLDAAVLQRCWAWPCRTIAMPTAAHASCCPTLALQALRSEPRWLYLTVLQRLRTYKDDDCMALLKLLMRACWSCISMSLEPRMPTRALNRVKCVTCAPSAAPSCPSLPWCYNAARHIAAFGDHASLRPQGGTPGRAGCILFLPYASSAWRLLMSTHPVRSIVQRGVIGR